ncbi:MAG: PhnA domain-containing protein [Enhygromyxa sp.]
MPDIQQFEDALHERAGGRCELCGAEAGLAAFAVPPGPALDSDRCVLLCRTCLEQLDGSAQLDPKHWFCLREAAWSEIPAVQVTSYRLLSRLSDQPWASELLEQLYLDDAVLEWARAGLGSGQAELGEDRPRTLDSNGVELAEGDSVTLIKDLDVKGAGFVAKRGTLVKGIHLTDNPEHVEGRVNKVAIVLKTRFLKKA